MPPYMNTIDVFVKYLIECGYPKERIILEWKVQRYAIDVVVVSDDMRTPIAAFEIKERKTREAIENGVKHMKRAAERLSISIPMSLVIGKNDPPFFQVFDISDVVYHGEVLDIEELMLSKETHMLTSYDTINSSTVGKQILKREEAKKEKQDWFKRICWGVIPLISIITLYFDAIDLFRLTTERLIVMGATLVVVLLPFFSEFSFGEFSAKRNREERK